MRSTKIVARSKDGLRELLVVEVDRFIAQHPNACEATIALATGAASFVDETKYCVVCRRQGHVALELPSSKTGPAAWSCPIPGY